MFVRPVDSIEIDLSEQEAQMLVETLRRDRRNSQMDSQLQRFQSALISFLEEQLDY